MNEMLFSEQAAVQIRKAIQKIREEIPQLSNVLDAFGELLAEQAAFKTELSNIETRPEQLDDVAFSQSVPILLKNAFTIPADTLKKSADRLIPVLMRGLPKISGQLTIIAKAIKISAPNSFNTADRDLILTHERISEWIVDLKVDPEIARFTLTQLVKPYAAKKAEALAELLHESRWFKGYCPICGSWPEIGFLEGQEGRRWLRCSFCSHEWNFSRTECPFCESANPDKLEIFYTANRPFERAELCYECKKYLISLDLRNRIGVIREVAALGMVYLDVLAQEKGFSPSAASAWNIFVQS
ncbi:MAG: formate dehydrogenase accessory protein FdhE [Desulfomonilaceae bacterium]